MMRSKIARILLLVLLVTLTGCGKQPVNTTDKKNEATETYAPFRFTAEEGEKIGITDFSGRVVIPATFSYGGVDYQIVSLGDEAFFGCNDMTEIVLPEGITSIGNEAFFNCASLESITIPSGLTNLGYGVFEWCGNLTSIKWKGNIYSGAYEFEAAWEKANKNISEE